jgi:hypothetical protein
LMVVGGLLATGPLWGMILTVVGMLAAFHTLATKPAGSEVQRQVAVQVSMGTWMTFIGLALLPIAVTMLVIGIVWMTRSRRRQETTGVEQSPPLLPRAPQSDQRPDRPVAR